MLDVVRYATRGVLECLVNVILNLFRLVALKERFHGSVVMAVAASAHPLSHFALVQTVAKDAAGVLRSSIAVND